MSNVVRRYIKDNELREKMYEINNNLSDTNSKEYSKILNAKNLTVDPTNQTLQMIEGRVWSTGDPRIIEDFYKKQYSQLANNSLSGEQTYQQFYIRVSGDRTRVHSGYPKLFNDTYVKLIAGPSFTEKVIVNGEENQDLTERLQEILEWNDFKNKMFHEIVFTKAMSGFNPLKVIIDKQEANVPILQPVDPENYEVLLKYNRPEAHIVTHYKEIEEVEYIIKEIYTTIKERDNDCNIISEEAVLLTKAYKKGTHGYYDKEVELSEIYPELESDNFGDQVQDKPGIQFGISTIPFMLNTNIDPSSMTQNYLGKSIHHKNFSLYHTIDESLSALGTDIRYGNHKLFMSEDIVPKDDKGFTNAYDPFETGIELLASDMDNDKEGLIKTIQGDIRNQELINTVDYYLSLCLQNVGLSPTTIGKVGTESIAASEDSQREREKTSIRTRDDELKRYKVELQTFFATLVNLDQVQSGGSEIEDLEVVVNFNDYASPALESRIKNAIIAKEVLPIEEVVELVFGDDKTDEEKAKIIALQKLEKNVDLNVADTLALGINPNDLGIVAEEETE